MMPSVRDYIFSISAPAIGVDWLSEFLGGETPHPPEPEKEPTPPFDDDMLHFVRAAVTREQIEEMSLPTRPTKIAGNSHARDWNPDEPSVELDAIPPKTLRAMVEACITSHVDPARIATMRTIEAEERKQLDIFRKSLPA
jgi:hypothetical protein